jgi:hypothetical protein
MILLVDLFSFKELCPGRNYANRLAIWNVRRNFEGKNYG